MFGMTTKPKKPTAAQLQNRIDFLEAQHRQLVAEKSFWQDQCMEYGNQIQFWQNKNRELLEQMFKESSADDLRAYAKAIQQHIEESRPKPAEIAAVLAMADKSTQGVFTPTLQQPITGAMVSRYREDL